jgi:hypothetical protein
MTTIKHVATALVLAACAATLPATDARAAKPAETTAPAPPSTRALVALETSAYAAWKSKDAKFWNTFLADNFVGYGASGKLDKASATTELTAANSEIKTYALSDEHITPIATNAALLTYKGTVDGTCDGQTLPPNSREASVYVRDGNTWKNIFHAEAPIFDTKSAPAKPAPATSQPATSAPQPNAPDPNTAAMLAVERHLWEAWRTHDAKKLNAVMATDISFINIYGTWFPTKSAALKDWTGTGCNVTSVSVTGATATMLSPTSGILTFTGTAIGTCYGQKINSSIWGTSIYVKHGNTWKWTFGINVPASN